MESILLSSGDEVRRHRREEGVIYTRVGFLLFVVLCCSESGVRLCIGSFRSLNRAASGDVFEASAF